MADEIRNQNVVRITRDARRWCARIGPDDSGVAAIGCSPASALVNLGVAMSRAGWTCDPGWNPRPERLHDA